MPFVRTEARIRLENRLDQLGLSKRRSYSAAEVQGILETSSSSFYRMIHRPEGDERYLKVVKGPEFRITYYELLAYFSREIKRETEWDGPLSPEPDIIQQEGFSSAAPSCPFCGGKEIEPVQHAHCEIVAFRCACCRAIGPEAHTLDFALELWSGRRNSEEDL